MLERLRSEQAGPVIVAAGIFLAVILLSITAVVISEVHEAVYHQYAASKAEADAKYRLQAKCAEVADIEILRSCFADAIRETREPQRSEEDLKAQKDMARYAFWMLLVTGFVGSLTIILTGVGVYFVRETLAETRRIGEAQTRAYVFAKEAIIFNSHTEHPTIRIKLFNTGASPAKYFRVGCVAYLRPYGTTSEYMIPADLDYGYWTGLGAGSSDTVGQHPAGLVERIGEADSQLGTRALIIAGRVIYCDIFGDEWESDFAFFRYPPFEDRRTKMSRAVARLKAYEYRGKSRPRPHGAAP